MPEVCVYALASRGGGRIGVRGVTGERLRAVRIGTVDAIVGHVASIPKPTEHNLRKYGQVIAALWRRSPALLPARFGTAVGDVADLTLLVGAREKTLRESLRHVRNRAQMTVRLMSADADVPRPATHTLATSGAEYLQARVADAQRTRDVPLFAPCREAVARWVKAERVEKRGSVATIYHLIPRASVDRYRAALERAALGTETMVLVSGPWPPYAFADSW